MTLKELNIPDDKFEERAAKCEEIGIGGSIMEIKKEDVVINCPTVAAEHRLSLKQFTSSPIGAGRTILTNICLDHMCRQPPEHPFMCFVG